ncbi:MAG: N-acetyltransferase family protein [Acutalibacteraceae bacterium]
MDKWTIRPARTGDFEAVVRMIAELMDFQGLEGETPVEAAVLERDVLQNGHPSVAVAEAAGELVGYVLYFPTYSSRYGRPCRYIEDVYVKAAHRGRGIGGALMRYVIDEAPRRAACAWSGAVWTATRRRGALPRAGAAPQDEWTTFRFEP